MAAETVTNLVQRTKTWSKAATFLRFMEEVLFKENNIVGSDFCAYVWKLVCFFSVL